MGYIHNQILYTVGEIYMHVNFFQQLWPYLFMGCLFCVGAYYPDFRVCCYLVVSTIKYIIM